MPARASTYVAQGPTHASTCLGAAPAVSLLLVLQKRDHALQRENLELHNTNRRQQAQLEALQQSLSHLRQQDNTFQADNQQEAESGSETGHVGGQDVSDGDGSAGGSRGESGDDHADVDMRSDGSDSDESSVGEVEHQGAVQVARASLPAAGQQQPKVHMVVTPIRERVSDANTHVRSFNMPTSTRETSLTISLRRNSLTNPEPLRDLLGTGVTVSGDHFINLRVKREARFNRKDQRVTVFLH
jgi:hypothetical protein